MIGLVNDDENAIDDENVLISFASNAIGGGLGGDGGTDGPGDDGNQGQNGSPGLNQRHLDLTP